ncbi:MAG: DUF4199 domain-containing protein [Chitinophagaceae bacterium]|nr:DUF4199 domain-containing protein [Chitinophagaceae bacterium]
MKPNIVNQGIQYGVICGLISIAIMYGSWAAGLNTFVTCQFYSNFIPYMILIFIFAGLQLRKQNDGVLSYADALKFTFLGYVVVAVMTAVSTYVLYNLIDKQLGEKSMQVALEKIRVTMEKFGASEEDIAKQMKKAEENPSTTPGKIFLGTGLFLIWDFIKSLLIALIIRKEKQFLD